MTAQHDPNWIPPSQQAHMQAIDRLTATHDPDFVRGTTQAMLEAKSRKMDKALTQTSSLSKGELQIECLCCGNLVDGPIGNAPPESNPAKLGGQIIYHLYHCFTCDHDWTMTQTIGFPNKSRLTNRDGTQNERSLAIQIHRALNENKA